jgi:hypothetical protein
MTLTEHLTRSSVWELFTRRWRYEHFHLRTRYTIAECRVRLSGEERLRPNSKIRTPNYQGRVTPGRFWIQRKGHTPYATGMFRSHQDHTDINLDIGNGRSQFIVAVVFVVAFAAIVITGFFIDLQPVHGQSEADLDGLRRSGNIFLIVGIPTFIGLLIHTNRKIPDQTVDLITHVISLLEAEIIEGSCEFFGLPDSRGSQKHDEN